MFAVPARSAGLIQSSSSRIVECYKITRTDGTIYKFTSHDRDVVLKDEVSGATETYETLDSVDMSAVRKESALKSQNMDAHGVISSLKISDDDLRAGMFFNATVEERTVDWLFPFAGYIVRHKFWIRRVVFDGEVWEAELDSLPQVLQAKVGHVYTRTCRVKLGDSKCTIDLAALTTAGVAVLGMLDGDSRRIIKADSTTLAAATDGYYDWGGVTFETGANAGLKGEIKTYVSATREITLQLPMPYRVLPTETFAIVPGCNKLKTTCKTKYANVINFRGYPYMPTTDRILRITPR